LGGGERGITGHVSASTVPGRGFERVSRHANVVSMSVPSQGYAPVLRLVAGGFVGALRFGFDAIDDLQLALELVLRSGVFGNGRAVVRLTSDEHGVTITVAGFERGTLGRRLEEVVGEDMELGRLLARLVDTVDAQDDTLTLRRAYEATTT